jgi:hypothetical protein
MGSRSWPRLFVTALLAWPGAGCAMLLGHGRLKPDGDPAARVEPVGGGTLVVRGFMHRARVGLISLDTGALHVLQLEHLCEQDPGSFAGPDARGRFVYVNYSRELVREPSLFDPTLALAFATPLERAAFGAAELVEPRLSYPAGSLAASYEESWRTKRPESKNFWTKRFSAIRPTRIFAGDVNRAGERVLLSRHPADLLQSLIALAPSTGEFAFFAFDFDGEGLPQGLHLEIWDLDGGEPRSISLGRVYLDVRGQNGPGLAWLGDERHLLFKRNTRVQDSGGMFELDGDWNGHTDSSSASDPNRKRSSWNSSHVRLAGFVLCVLDTWTGEWHDLEQGPYGWPCGDGDELLASDGKQLWLVHGASGASECLCEIGPESPLRTKGGTWVDPELSILAADGPERILARKPADKDAALPCDWSLAFDAIPSEEGLQLVVPGEEWTQTCVPLLAVGLVQHSRYQLPSGLPKIRRRLNPPPE